MTAAFSLSLSPTADMRCQQAHGMLATMDTRQLKAFCASRPGAHVQLYDDARNVLVYSIGGRQFAYFKTSEPERWRFSIKVTPERFLELTDVPGIKPARWMGRFRWITIVDVRSVPDAYLRELVDWSYRHALSSLSRARRASLMDPTASTGTPH